MMLNIFGNDKPVFDRFTGSPLKDLKDGDKDKDE